MCSASIYRDNAKSIKDLRKYLYKKIVDTTAGSYIVIAKEDRMTNRITPKDVKEIRLSLGLSRDQLAAELGITATTVANWEFGRVEKLHQRSQKDLRTLQRKAQRANQ